MYKHTRKAHISDHDKKWAYSIENKDQNESQSTDINGRLKPGHKWPQVPYNNHYRSSSDRPQKLVITIHLFANWSRDQLGRHVFVATSFYNQPALIGKE